MPALSTILRSLRLEVESRIKDLIPNSKSTKRFSVYSDSSAQRTPIKSFTGKPRVFHLGVAQEIDVYYQGYQVTGWKYRIPITIAYPRNEAWAIAAQDDIEKIRNDLLTTNGAHGIDGVANRYVEDNLSVTKESHSEDPWDYYTLEVSAWIEYKKDWIELTTDQTIPETISLIVVVNTGQTVWVNWGDGTKNTYTSDDTTVIYPQHTYTSGNYIIQVGGDLDDLLLFNVSSSTLGGNISTFTVLNNLASLILQGTSMSGDVGILKTIESIDYIYLNETNVSYTSTSLPAWPGRRIRLQDNGWDETTVDAFLVDLADGVGSNGILNIDGTNAARSSASDAAVTALEAAGWAITVNT